MEQHARRLAHRLALLVAGVLLVTAQSVSMACPAAACSCLPPDPVRVGREAAYVAKVRVDRTTSARNGFYVFTVTPTALYKGPGLEPTTVATASQEACGLGPRETGSVLMIVAYPAKGDVVGKAPYAASWCSLLTEEQAERVLGRPRTQELPPAASPRALDAIQLVAIGVGAALILGLGVAYAVLRRRRR